jgi:hypothetical protein
MNGKWSGEINGRAGSGKKDMFSKTPRAGPGNPHHP